MVKKYRIMMISTSRADLSLWKPIFDNMDRDSRFDCKLLITGTHFLKECGDTYLEAEKLFKPGQCVFLSPEKGSKPFKWYSHMAEMFHDYLKREQVDLLFFLGDRIELMPLLTIGLYLIRPIAHIYAGEEDLTYSHDTQVRNALTKAAHILMVTHEDVKKRLLQMGEEAWRIKIVGNSQPVTFDRHDDRILCFLEKHGFDIQNKKLVNCCYHSTTTTPMVWKKELPGIFKALDHYGEYTFIWTGVNADNESADIRKMIQTYVTERKNHLFFDHLGGELYRSLLINSHFMIGNSSSGLLEAPIYKLPSVNIGNRNAGRLHGKSVVDCRGDESEIDIAIKKALSMDKENIVNVFENINFPQNINDHIAACLTKTDLMIKRMNPIDYRLERVPEYR